MKPISPRCAAANEAGVQNLQRQQQRDRRIERHCGPAQDRAGAADRDAAPPGRVSPAAARQRKQRDLGHDADAPERADQRAVEACGAPLHGGKPVVERVAALDQADASATAINAGLRQQRFRRLRGGSPAGAAGLDRIERHRRHHRQHQRAHDQPDQVAGRERSSITPATTCRRRRPRSPTAAPGHRCGRAPKPAQRIGIGQRQHRRKCHRRDRERTARSRPSPCTRPTAVIASAPQSTPAIAAERAPPVGPMCYQRCCDDSHHHRHRDDEADGLRVEPPRLQPKREKRQLDPAEEEICGVEQP